MLKIRHIASLGKGSHAPGKTVAAVARSKRLAGNAA
jgi:hypothetical protein